MEQFASFVVKVDSINVFKKRLDKYWSYQDFMFDYTAEIAERSVDS